ncbi:MAG TPA: DoxX family protein [Thermoanaerobaculia bacterium]|nr:DoxX family protein [Thermoanaerobaculia bacterium]
MKVHTIGYWTATGLTALAFGSGGILQLLGNPGAVEGIRHLGYPAHFIILLGVWKLLGALAVLAPRFPRLKEWAYAGMFFDLTAASVAHAAVGDPLGNVVVPILLLGIVMASWALRPQERTIAGAPLRPVMTPVARTTE